jgi:hypothetical protein
MRIRVEESALAELRRALEEAGEGYKTELAKLTSLMKDLMNMDYHQNLKKYLLIFQVIMNKLTINAILIVFFMK